MILSGGELARVLAAGGDPKNRIFGTLGKTAEDIRSALEVGIACFNVESEAELYRINDTVAGKLQNKRLFRYASSPNVDAQTHPYISTGLKENKFGITHEDAPCIYQITHDLPHLKVVGIDCHIGSPVDPSSAFMDALDKVIEMIHAPAKTQGIVLEHIDLGAAWVCSILDGKTLQVTNLRSYSYQN